MGVNVQKIMQESHIVRDMFYRDGHECKKIKKCKYKQYLLDNKDNEKVLDEAIKSKGIKLVIAPTGAGKSYSLIERARILTSQDKNCKVIIALPTRTLALQVGNQKDVYKMVGGDNFDAKSQIIASTYEKMFEIENYIMAQRTLKQQVKIHLILDECHLLVSQHLFREQAIKSLIQYIEKNYFESTLLVSATPSPMSLFRADEIIQFQSTNRTPVIDKVEIVVVDDAAEYIKNLDFQNEFPFIRLNNKPEIDRLIKDMSQKMARITRDDKNTSYYKDIVDNSKIDNTGIDGMLATSVLEAGVNITDYPENIIPTAVFTDCKISTDDIEQFLNRVRRTAKNHVKCARVVLNRPKERELRAELITNTGNVVCRFSDLVLKMGNFYINDVAKMDTVADGDYKIRISIGRNIIYRTLQVASIGGTDVSRYSKEDAMPLMFEEIGFRPFINILKANHRNIERFKESLQGYVDALQVHRERKKLNENLSDNKMDDLENKDEILIEKMAKGAIDDKGELKDCLSYVNGKILVDKRILYMVSYNQFQRQYYYNHEMLQKELKARMNTSVILRNENNEKGVHTAYNVKNIWEDIEHLRHMIVFDDEFWKALVGEVNCYTTIGIKRNEIREIKKQQHLIELLQELDKSGVSGTVALQVLTFSKTKSKITQYANTHKMIINNQSLKKIQDEARNTAEKVEIEKITFLNKNLREKIQAAIFCYLEQGGKSSYKVTDMLAEEIISFYKKSFPLSVKFPTVRQIKSKLKQMYKTKGSDTIRNELHTDANYIFKLVKADY
ncbi:MAG: DEAD/DEAH box helicase [Lachnospiraceae bacterium]|nr:DEAD/DEAH box helicase [Lachnospiraceae bacterium]